MDPSAAYSRSFFEMHVPWRAEYEAIADLLVARLTFLSVIDMGCGNGFIINRLAQLGKEVIGVDGSLHAIAAAPAELQPRLKAADLTQPLRLGHYDLVICSEVAEHLEARHAGMLLENICGNSAGSVFFTAATPGQGSFCHVNEQPHDYWIGMLHSAVSTSTPSRHQACDAIYRSAYIRFGGSRRMPSFFGARALSESLLRGLRNSIYAGPDHPAGAQQHGFGAPRFRSRQYHLCDTAAACIDLLRVRRRSSG